MLTALRTPRARAWIAAGAPIVALVLISMAVSAAMLFSFAKAQDRAYAESTSRLVTSTWREREAATVRVALDYAIWNDAYFATTISWDADWVVNNLYSNVADAIVVVRADGRIRHAWVADTIAAHRGAIEQGVIRAVRDELNVDALSNAAGSQPLTASTTFIADGAPVVISVAPLSPEEETVRLDRHARLPVDYLVAVDFVTPAELQETATHLDIGRLEFKSSGDAAGYGARVLALKLQSASGEQRGALVWSDERPGSVAFLGNAGAMAGFFVILGVFAVLIARKLVHDQMKAAAEISGAHEASRMKSEFISTMSHELRTPLNAIIGYCELIKEEVTDCAPAAMICADADRVLGAAHHLSRLINDVLEQSRIDAGKLDVSMERVNAAGALQELQELMAPLACATGNQFNIVVAGDAGEVAADPVRLQQCLINLTTNALKFTNAGRVDVSVYRVREAELVWVHFDVIDTGIGISPSDLAAAFKPFSQANKEISEKYGGTGLGLTITRSLAHAMGGEVSVVSKPGHGSTFTLRLRVPDVTAQSDLVRAA